MALEISSPVLATSDVSEDCRAPDLQVLTPAGRVPLSRLVRFFGQSPRRVDAVALQQYLIDLKKHRFQSHKPQFFRNETLTRILTSGRFGSMIDAIQKRILHTVGASCSRSASSGSMVMDV